MEQDQVARDEDVRTQVRLDGPLLPSMADDLEARVLEVPRDEDARYWFRQGAEWAAIWVVRNHGRST